MPFRSRKLLAGSCGLWRQKPSHRRGLRAFAACLPSLSGLSRAKEGSFESFKELLAAAQELNLDQISGSTAIFEGAKPPFQSSELSRDA